MRKLLPLLVLFAALGVGQSFAQCTPNPLYVALGLPGLQPSTLIQDTIPDATENQAYSYNFTVIVPADTTIDISAVVGLPVPPVTVSVAAIRIDNVTGMPTGLSYACDTAACYFPKETAGCVVLTGTPTDPGSYTVNFGMELGFIVPSGFPLAGTTQFLPIPGQNYDMRVANNMVGIEELEADRFSVVQNGPNPFRDYTEIHYNAPRPGQVSLQVTDLQGRVLRTSSHKANLGRNLIRFEANGMAPGVYFYTLSDSKSSVTHKMVVAD